MNKNKIKINKILSGKLTTLIGLFLVSTAPIAAPSVNGVKPVDSSYSVVIDANSVKPGECAFDVGLDVKGKAKTITLPDNRFIYTSPGLNAEVTNLSDPTKTVSLSLTGAFHTTINSNGDTLYIVTGRNFLTDPEAGVVLAIGTFRFAFNADGTLIEPLNGQGQLINICDLIN